MYQLAIKSSEVVSIRSVLGTKVTEIVKNADICSNMQTKHDSITSEPTDLLQDIQYCNDELRNFVLGCTSPPHSKHKFTELSRCQQQRRLKQLKKNVK